MNRDEFLGKVRERGEYADLAEAEHVTRTVLATLGQRLGADAKDLAAQLPADLGGALPSGGIGEAYGELEFLRRVAEHLGATTETARWDASAVLSTLAASVTGSQLNQVLGRLPSGYADLFGKPELA
jgi:uncharacterized protein (DUF2267 family)